jgi:multidrug efflux pump subunit AcrA (membrane-fusion protein)
MNPKRNFRAASPALARGLLALAASLALCRGAQARDYQWAKVVLGGAEAGLRVTGRVVPQDGALTVLSAPAAGRVLGILRREGEAVEQGTAVFQISSAECASLAEENRIAEAHGLDELKDSVQRRQAQMGLKVGADGCQVLSLSKGVVAKRFVEAGAVFNAGDALANIVDLARLAVQLDIPERDLASVRRGQGVRFHLDSSPGTVFFSTLVALSPSVDPASRSVVARLQPVPLPVGTSLDALAYGEIATGAEAALLKVPSTALVFSHDAQYVVKGGGHPQAVEVQVVSESDSFSAVRPVKAGALAAGDEVASDGAIFLFDKLNG